MSDSFPDFSSRPCASTPAKETSRLPLAVDRVVRAHCEDYDRRRRAIAEGRLSPETLGHYMVLNAKIDRAIASCCEESFCEEMREDIAAAHGHRNSRLYFISPGTFKARKRETKIAIAKALHLL